MLTEREYDEFRLDQEERTEALLLDIQTFVLGDRAKDLEQPKEEPPVEARSAPMGGLNG